MARRWFWLAGVSLVLATLFCAVWRGRQRSAAVQVRMIAEVFAANGREQAVLTVEPPGNGSLRAEELSAAPLTREAATGEGKDGVRAEQAGRAVTLWMRAPAVAGEQRLRVQWRGGAATRTLRFAADTTDSFGDGLPDALRLHTAADRAAFRQWFWRLAETEGELPAGERAPEIQDCAALVRYAYREALRTHDAAWAASQHLGGVAFESVQQWRYPRTMLGAGLFRVRPGPFTPGDESNGAFAQFADAHALMAWNSYRVGRDLRAARPGDMIFYRQLEQNSPYHSMVITGGDAGWVVYHTGPIGKEKGEMRRMALTDLLRHPDARWRPIAENSNFLGVYRWNLLREGD